MVLRKARDEVGGGLEVEPEQRPIDDLADALRLIDVLLVLVVHLAHEELEYVLLAFVEPMDLHQVLLLVGEVPIELILVVLTHHFARELCLFVEQASRPVSLQKQSFYDK